MVSSVLTSVDDPIVKSKSRMIEVRSSAGTLPSLDGLRAVSISLVLLSHFVNSKVFPGGLGVLLFFVISGFLITRQLIMEYKAIDRISLTRFYARRIIRLYPVAVVSICVITIAGYMNGISFSIMEPISALFYFANYYYSDPIRQDLLHHGLPVSIFWSLSIEEQFYVVFPLAFVLLVKRPTHLMIFTIGAILLPLVLRCVMVYSYPDLTHTKYFYFRTEYRMDSIASGVILALAMEHPVAKNLLRWLERPKAFWIAVSAIFVCLAIRDSWFRETIRYTILNFSMVVVVYCAVFNKCPSFVFYFLNLRPVMIVGKLSYSIYVWHLSVGLLFGIHIFPVWLHVPALFILTALLATMSYLILEKPFEQLRRRLHVKRRPDQSMAISALT